MACSRDENCNYLASVTYPNHKNKINENICRINKIWEDIKEKFIEFELPNDYLGGKVLEELKKINEEIDLEVADLSSTNQSINGFIDSKIYEHRRHYNEWKASQQVQNSATSSGSKEQSSTTNTGKKGHNLFDFTSRV